jgi:23S rRNA pseudouridine955/2504/2580 synthase
MSWNVGQVVTLSVDADEDDTRLDRWLKRKFHGLTQGQIEKACRTGEIRVDGARAKANTRVKAGQTVRIPPMTAAKGREGDDEDDKPRTRVKASDADMMRSLVIYEDDHIIGLNKPPGLAVQGGTGTTRHIDALSRALVPDTAEKPRLVHRLDRDTSGVLILAKTVGTANRLGALFRSRELDKIYWAVVLGVPHPTTGDIRGWMIKSTGPKDDKEKMRAMISSTTFDTINGKVKFDGVQNSITPTAFVQTQKGKLQIVWPASLASSKFEAKKGW